MTKINYNHEVDGFSDSQIIHDPRQIKSQGELQIGKRYVQYHKKQGMLRKRLGVIEILAIDFPKKVFFKVNRTFHEKVVPKVEEIFMTDNGIIPYDFGKWNATDYLIPVINPYSRHMVSIFDSTREETDFEQN